MNEDVIIEIRSSRYKLMKLISRKFLIKIPHKFSRQGRLE